jgi:hypothetical protein
MCLFNRTHSDGWPDSKGGCSSSPGSNVSANRFDATKWQVPNRRQWSDVTLLEKSPQSFSPVLGRNKVHLAPFMGEIVMASTGVHRRHPSLRELAFHLLRLHILSPLETNGKFCFAKLNLNNPCSTRSLERHSF